MRWWWKNSSETSIGPSRPEPTFDTYFSIMSSGADQKSQNQRKPPRRIYPGYHNQDKADHQNILACRWEFSMRSQAMSKYFGSISIPMNFLPRFMQATPVVPLPMKGSRIAPPRSVAHATSGIRILGGFSCGCSSDIAAPRTIESSASFGRFGSPTRKTAMSSC